MVHRPMIRRYNIDSLAKKNILILICFSMLWISIPYTNCLIFATYHANSQGNGADSYIRTKFETTNMQPSNSVKNQPCYVCHLPLREWDLILSLFSKIVISPAKVVALSTFLVFPVLDVGQADIESQNLQFSSRTSLFSQKTSLLIYH
jgi:hypothetical protein